MALSLASGTAARAVASGGFADWHYSSPGVLRIVLALAMLVVTAAIAGRRVRWLVRLIRSGAADTSRTREREARAVKGGEEVLGQRKLLKWTGAGLAHFFTFWGFNILGITIVEVLRRAGDQQGLRLPDLRARALAGLPRGLLRRRRAGGDHLVRDQPGAQRARAPPARAPVLRLAHRSGLGRARHDLLVVATLLVYRGAQYNTGHFPFGALEVGRSRPTRWPSCSARRLQPGHRDTFLLLQMAVIFGFTVLVVYSKHLHIGTAPLNVLSKRDARRAGPAAAGDRRRGHADRLRRRREPVRGHRVRQGQDRGLHLEGLPRLRHLHRVRPLPVPVPGLEHRQAAVAQAADHGPARPPVRQGAVPARRPTVPGRAADVDRGRGRVARHTCPRPASPA